MRKMRKLSQERGMTVNQCISIVMVDMLFSETQGLYVEMVYGLVNLQDVKVTYTKHDSK